MLNHQTFKQINTLFRKIRQNHGIEHAAVAILTKRKIKPPIIGLATTSGFIIYCKSNKDEMLSATNEAVKLINSGASELAISQFCGTNIVVGATISGLSALILSKLLGKNSKGIVNIASGFFISTLLSKPIGRIVQKYITTNSSIDGIQVKYIRSLNLGKFYIHHIGTGYGEPHSD